MVRMTPETIGRAIRWHRKKAGLSRRLLSEYSGVGTTAIYDIEHGKPGSGIGLVLRLLEILNVELRFEGPHVDEFENEANENDHD